MHELALQKESRISAGHIMPDPIHMLIEIPPKHGVAKVGVCIKGKSAIDLQGGQGAA